MRRYEDNSPKQIDGESVIEVLNFAKDKITDSEGVRVPSEKMLIFKLADGRRIAVRGSGTEPKIKYYLFANCRPKAGERLSPTSLQTAKVEIHDKLERTWQWILGDMKGS